jgi:hypothetical protein
MIDLRPPSQIIPATKKVASSGCGAVEHLMYFCIMWVSEASPALLAGSGLIPEVLM